MAKPNGYVLHQDADRVIIATGFKKPSQNRKTGKMIQVWILARNVDPVTAVKTGQDELICGNCPHRGTIAPKPIRVRDRAKKNRKNKARIVQRCPRTKRHRYYCSRFASKELCVYRFTHRESSITARVQSRRAHPSNHLTRISGAHTMANYVVTVKLPYEDSPARFGVFHSGSSTMFSATFDDSEEILAHMFAREFSRPFCDHSDAAQLRIASELRAFILSVFPTYQESSIEPLPEAWRAAVPNPNDDEWPFTYDVSDLLSWYENGDDRLDVCQDAFRAWRRAHGVAA